MNNRFLLGWVLVLFIGGAAAWTIWLRPGSIVPSPFQPSLSATEHGAHATPTQIPKSFLHVARVEPTPVPAITRIPTETPVPAHPLALSDNSALNLKSRTGLLTDATVVAAPSPTILPTETQNWSGGVPILMYHYIRVNPVASDRIGFNLSITPLEFADQMHWLSAHGFHAVTMAQVRGFIRDGAPLPAKPVALTFDDGYDDAYTVARPILDQNHLTATFFVVTSFVGQPRYMTWEQVAALDQDGMEIGSHTVHHLGLPRLSAALRTFELADSRSVLEGHLGHSVLDFCYPGGEIDSATIAATGEAGYLSATTTRYGVVRRGDNPLELPRIRVYGGITLPEFAAELQYAVSVLPPKPAPHAAVSRPPATPIPHATPTAHISSSTLAATKVPSGVARSLPTLSPTSVSSSLHR